MRGRLLRVSILCLLLFTPSSAMAFGWSAPETVNTWADSDSDSDSSSAAVTDSSGNLHVVWKSENGMTGFYPDIYYSTDTGGTWSEPIRVTTGGAFGISAVSAAPSLAIDSDNTLYAVWHSAEDSSGAGVDFDVVYSENSGTGWSEMELINPDGYSDSANDEDPIIAVDADGNLHVVWVSDGGHDGGGGNDDIYYSTSSGSGWSAPDLVNSFGGAVSGEDANPHLAITGSGGSLELHVVWQSRADFNGAGSLDYDVFYSTNSGSGWSTAVLVNSFGNDDTGADSVPRVALNGDKAHVIWKSGENYNESGGDDDIYHSSNSGSGWSAPALVNQDDESASLAADDSSPDLVVSSTGTMHAIWTLQEFINYVGYPDIAYSTNSGSGWSTPAILTTAAESESGSNFSPRIVESATGLLHVSWYSNEDIDGVGTDYDIFTASLTPDNDGDGMSDVWEVEHGLDPAVDDSASDKDNDGYTNLHEFLAGSNPTDELDLPTEVFVDGSDGSDTSGTGRPDSQWKTISHAIDQVVGTEEFPININVDYGTYQEQIDLDEYESIVGADAEYTIIQWFEASEYVIKAADNTEISGVTVTTPGPESANINLLEARDVAVEITDTVFDGKDNFDSVGVFVTGTGSSDTKVLSSTFRRLGFGVRAVNSGAVFANNMFEDINDDAVFVRPPDTLNANGTSEVPNFGDENDLTTGNNTFKNVQDKFVDNAGPEMKAENNDWSVYTESEISAKMSGSVDFMPFKKANMATLFVTIDGQGTVELNPPGGSYTVDIVLTLVTLTASADVGWQFDRWELDATGSANPTTVLMDSDKDVRAVFVEGGEGEGEGEGESEGEGEGEGPPVVNVTCSTSSTVAGTTSSRRLPHIRQLRDDMIATPMERSMVRGYYRYK
ncbi:hypothetical protein ACFL1X_02275 [Candidatus Hydrogenedentota bacterium]